MSKVLINNRFIKAVNYLLDEKIVESKGILASKLGIKASKFSEILNSRMNIGVDLASSLCKEYRISEKWLLNGDGNMCQNKTNIDNEIKNEKNLLNNQNKNDPSYPLLTQINVREFCKSNFEISKFEIKDYYTIPKFKNSKIDFMIEVNGCSMYPKYNNGDIIACSIIKNSNFVQWNRCHVIATENQGILIKRLMKSPREGFITATSDNNIFPPFDIPQSEICGIALVIGIIHLE